MVHLVRSRRAATIVFFNLLAVCNASWGNPYEELFPDYNPAFQQFLAEGGPCHGQYMNYLTWKNDTDDDLDDDTGLLYVRPQLVAFSMTSPTHEVADCLLENVPELVKSRMASAQVLLGLVPTLLATMGAGPQETGILAIVGRNWVLALLLSVGSPAVFPIRSFEHMKSLEDLAQRPMHRPDLLQRLGPMMTFVEWTLAMASVANIAELAWELGARAIFTTFPNAEWVTAIWMFVGVFIHILGTITISMRTRIDIFDSRSDAPESGHGHDHSRPHIISHMGRFYPRRYQHKHRKVTILPESTWFFILAWFTSILTAAHIIFGTMVFSGALFISDLDAMVVIGRLLGSVVVCRMILTYRLSIVRTFIHVESQHKRKDEFDTSAEPFVDRSDGFELRDRHALK